MSLNEILKVLNLEDKRASLRGSLAGYAKEGRVFTREQDQADTFGLLEFKRNGHGDAAVTTKDNQDEKKASEP